MTNTTNIPEWVQAAIAKLNEKHDEKRQQFKQQGNRYHDGFADGLEAAETIFMREFERAEPQSGWISVADRLPEHSQEVIACTNAGLVSYDYLTSKGEWHWAKFEEGCVTHWQPFPQPPKASE